MLFALLILGFTVFIKLQPDDLNNSESITLFRFEALDGKEEGSLTHVFEMIQLPLAQHNLAFQCSGWGSSSRGRGRRGASSDWFPGLLSGK